MSAKNQINFKNFSLEEIKNIHPDINVIPREIKINQEVKYTIGDCPDIRLNAGSENLYLDIVIYEVDKFDPINISIWSKEFHSHIKEIAKAIVESF